MLIPVKLELQITIKPEPMKAAVFLLPGKGD